MNAWEILPLVRDALAGDREAAAVLADAFEEGMGERPKWMEFNRETKEITLYRHEPWPFSRRNPQLRPEFVCDYLRFDDPS
jgi:hypothetical protein